MDDFLQKLKKVVRIVLYGPAISQSDYRKASPYQLPFNKSWYSRRTWLVNSYQGMSKHLLADCVVNAEKYFDGSHDVPTKRSEVHTKARPKYFSSPTNQAINNSFVIWQLRNFQKRAGDFSESC